MMPSRPHRSRCRQFLRHPLLQRLALLALTLLAACLSAGPALDGPTSALLRLDRTTGTWDPVADHPPHDGDLLLDPTDGRLLQQHPDGLLDDLGPADLPQLQQATAAHDPHLTAEPPEATDLVWLLSPTEDPRVRPLTSVPPDALVAHQGHVYRTRHDAQGQLSHITPTGDILTTVEQTHTSRVRVIVDLDIAFEDGGTDTIEVTPEHPFWHVDRQDWVEVWELQEGARLQVHGGGTAIVVGKTWRQGDFEVVNLGVRGPRNYYVGEAGGDGEDGDGDVQRAVLVHNKGGDSSGGGGFIVHPNGTAVHRSQAEMVESITRAGATRVGPTSRGDGTIYKLDTPAGPMEVRVMDGTTGGGPHSGPRTVTTRDGTQNAAGMGGERVQANGDPFPNGTSRADRQAGGHTHGQVNDR